MKIHRINVPNNINILCNGEDNNRPNRCGKLRPLLWAYAATEVEEVLIVGVVEGSKQPKEAGESCKPPFWVYFLHLFVFATW